MCLAVPMQIESIDGLRGVAAVDGVSREIRLDLLEGARVRDWVLVHAGYAIQVLDAAAAAETLAWLAELMDRPPTADETP